MQMTRRTLVGAGSLGALGYVGLTQPFGQSLEAKSASDLRDRDFPKPFATAFQPLPRLEPLESYTDADGVPTQYYRVTAKAGAARILSSYLTPVIGYNGLVPGPTISVERGTRVRLCVRNKLSPTGGHPGHEGYGFGLSTHLHGHASLPEYDGYASDLTRPGHYKEYVYENDQQARTIWYHDHASHITSENVYAGLAAHYHIHDEEERDLLPQGAFDVPLTLSDIMFYSNGVARLDDKDHSGLWGDIVLVNGKPWPVMQVQRRVYRFRLLNASLSRSYRPYLSNGDPVVMVATDGGLMPTSRQASRWRHGPAERYEFLIDFSKYPVGTEIRLMNASNEKNVDFDHTNKIMAFRVTSATVDKGDPTWNRIPQTLASSTVMSLVPSQSVRRRYLEMKKSDVTNIWSINNKTWDDVIASNFQQVLANPGLHDVETWDLETSSGGWFHPLHIHLVDFQILSRNGRAPADYERGPKDVAYLGPDELVRVLVKFERKGRYMVHCHNLPHEDHDMMGQFRVGLRADEYDDHDPITASPAKIDDLPD
jgi:FtsP/CotA-like multicopper oxidase with cupredoxin domain